MKSNVFSCHSSRFRALDIWFGESRIVVDVSPAKNGGDLDRFSRGGCRTHVVEPQSYLGNPIYMQSIMSPEMPVKRSSHKDHHPEHPASHRP